eukprot:SAG31_NODE_2004_length_6685_cov_2.189341_3_plen_45_part_00
MNVDQFVGKYINFQYYINSIVLARNFAFTRSIPIGGLCHELVHA